MRSLIQSLVFVILSASACTYVAYELSHFNTMLVAEVNK